MKWGIGIAPLLRWVLSLLAPNRKQIADSVDATTISNKFVVLWLNILLAGSEFAIVWSDELVMAQYSYDSATTC